MHLISPYRPAVKPTKLYINNDSDRSLKQQNATVIFVMIFTALQIPKLLKKAQQGTLPHPLNKDFDDQYIKLVEETANQFQDFQNDPNKLFQDHLLFQDEYKKMYDYLIDNELTDNWNTDTIKEQFKHQTTNIIHKMFTLHKKKEISITSNISSNLVNNLTPHQEYIEKAILKESLEGILKNFNDQNHCSTKFCLKPSANSEKILMTTINDFKKKLLHSNLIHNNHIRSNCSISREQFSSINPIIFYLFIAGLSFSLLAYKQFKSLAIPFILAALKFKINKFSINNLQDRIVELNVYYNKLSEKKQDDSLKEIPLFTVATFSFKPSDYSSNLSKIKYTIMDPRRKQTVEYVQPNRGLYLPPSANKVPEHVSRIWHSILILNCYLDDAADGCLPKDLKEHGYKLTQQYAKDAAFMCFFFMLHTLKDSEFQNFIDDIKEKIFTLISRQTIPYETVDNSIVSNVLFTSLCKQAPQFSFSLSNFPWFQYNFNFCMIDYLSGCRLDNLITKLDNFKSLRREYTLFLKNLNKFNQLTIAEQDPTKSYDLAKFLLSSKPPFQKFFKYLGANKDTVYTSYRFMNFLLTSNVLALSTKSTQSLSVLQIQQLTLSHVYDSQQVKDHPFIDSNATTPMLQASFLSYFFKNTLDSIVESYKARLAPPLSINIHLKYPPLSVTHNSLPSNKLENFTKNFLYLLEKNKDLLQGQPVTDVLNLPYFITNFLSIQKLNELIYIGDEFYNQINGNNSHLTDIVARDPNLLNSLIELYIYFEQIDHTQLLAKYANDIDCLNEITDVEYTLVPVSTALIGLSTPERLQQLLRNLLELNNNPISPQEALTQFLGNATYEGQITYNIKSNPLFYFSTETKKNPNFLKKIIKNLPEIEKVFRDIIGEFEKKLIDHYTAQDFFSLYTQKPNKVIHSIINNLTKILDMYIKRLKHDLKKHFVTDIPPNQTPENEKPLSIALKSLPKQDDSKAKLSDGSPTKHTKLFDSLV